MNASGFGFAGAAMVSLLVAGSHVRADWSDDPLVNLAVVDAGNGQVQPQIVVAADGSSYVSWFDNRGGGHDVYLQRLDAQGNELWAHNGVLVADRSFSSTQSYGLSLDSAGNALLAFRDDRFVGVQITAAKVDPTGALVWGANGVQLTSTTDAVNIPTIAGTTDGAAVVAWNQGSETRLRKLDAGGVPAWLADVVISDAAGFVPADLEASDSGGVIVSLVKGFIGATLHAQKLSTTGALLWGPTPVAVFDGGTLQIANRPAFVSDGSGGAVFGWYSVSPLQSHAQRILANGSEQFPHNGVEAATQAGRERTNPSVDFDPTTQEVFLFWREAIPGPMIQQGVYGQKFSPGGSRQWTDNGLAAVPIGGRERVQVRTVASGGGAAVYHVETLSFGNQRVHGAGVDGAGSVLWSTLVSSIASGKSRLAATLGANDVSLLVWQDDRTDADDLYAQNVNADGTLGYVAPACAADLTGDDVVSSADLVALILDWGCADPPGPCVGDVNGDGAVNSQDLVALVLAWGPC